MIEYWQQRSDAYRADIKHIEEKMKTELDSAAWQMMQSEKTRLKGELEVCLLAVSQFRDKKAG